MTEPQESGGNGSIARHLLVRGHVQGVFYRNWTVSTARALGLRGWVRNLSSGEVEILAIGEAPAIDALVTACRTGPPAAVVAEIVVSQAESEAATDFVKRSSS